jgi:hypothetical protein
MIRLNNADNALTCRFYSSAVLVGTSAAPAAKAMWAAARILSGLVGIR